MNANDKGLLNLKRGDLSTIHSDRELLARLFLLFVTPLQILNMFGMTWLPEYTNYGLWIQLLIYGFLDGICLITCAIIIISMQTPEHAGTLSGIKLSSQSMITSAILFFIGFCWNYFNDYEWIWYVPIIFRIIAVFFILLCYFMDFIVFYTQKK